MAEKKAQASPAKPAGREKLPTVKELLQIAESRLLQVLRWLRPILAFVIAVTLLAIVSIAILLWPRETAPSEEIPAQPAVTNPITGESTPPPMPQGIVTPEAPVTVNHDERSFTIDNSVHNEYYITQYVFVKNDYVLYYLDAENGVVKMEDAPEVFLDAPTPMPLPPNLAELRERWKESQRARALATTHQPHDPCTCTKHRH
jgi:hypothetical protein